ncbi:MAG: hypothetical protein ACJA1V_000939, partial [Flavobacteriaceae bacterium]
LLIAALKKGERGISSLFSIKLRVAIYNRYYYFSIKNQANSMRVKRG